MSAVPDCDLPIIFVLTLKNNEICMRIFFSRIEMENVN